MDIFMVNLFRNAYYVSYEFAKQGIPYIIYVPFLKMINTRLLSFVMS